MQKYLDINKIYFDTEGQPFSHVVLDNRQGVESDRGNYMISSGETQVTLPEEQFSFIQSACSKADALLEEGTRESTVNAFRGYAGALAELPEPTHSWHAAGWILSRMGECYFRIGSFEQAQDLYADLMWHPGAIGNPWIHLRKGQINFELGEMDKAGGELIRAYMGGGKDIFSLEDPKYYEYLKTVAEGLE
jgi:hypothetical protein